MPDILPLVQGRQEDHLRLHLEEEQGLQILVHCSEHKPFNRSQIPVSIIESI